MSDVSACLNLANFFQQMLLPMAELGMVEEMMLVFSWMMFGVLGMRPDW